MISIFYFSFFLFIYSFIFSVIRLFSFYLPLLSSLSLSFFISWKQCATGFMFVGNRMQHKLPARRSATQHERCARSLNAHLFTRLERLSGGVGDFTDCLAAQRSLLLRQYSRHDATMVSSSSIFFFF